MSPTYLSDMVKKQTLLKLKNLTHFKFKKSGSVLETRNIFKYEISIEACVNSSQLLDKILQLHNKSWCTCAMIGELIEAVELICFLKKEDMAQGVFCPCGVYKKVAW